jgi:hypothetical protein
MGDLSGWQGKPHGVLGRLFLYRDCGPPSRKGRAKAANGSYSAEYDAVFKFGCSKLRSGGAIIEFCKRISAGIGNPRTPHTILCRKDLLIIHKPHQTPMFKITRHLDIADPNAVVWSAKMRTTIVTKMALP